MESQSFWKEQNREAAVLTAHATASDLAAAALLLPPNDATYPRALDLIGRAEALAPRRPELVWLHLAICKRLKCDTETQISARLQAVDPDNGFAWALDLERVRSSGPDAVTTVIARIGAAPRMTVYWNQLEVMMVDALAVANPSRNLTTRYFAATGVLAALAVPPLLPMATACRPAWLDLPGRRTACEAMLARMEQSSTEIAQSLALSMQVRLWPPGSPQREVVCTKRRRLDYLLTTSTRLRWWRLNRDVALRIEAARRTDREEDVELAVVKSLGLPPEPPVRWNDSLRPIACPR